jgi:hypothetical protein
LNQNKDDEVIEKKNVKSVEILVKIEKQLFQGVKDTIKR